ncbi:MAG: DEAD/DEAH box helicase [Nostoc sp.]|uniref:DEAD/DEAH box helicase n=1 Tax=Nostoc sp. TaxID=1180 RepID=UPI002FF48329
MKILHGTWIPNEETDFIQSGSFYLWVETQLFPKSHTNSQQVHPGHLFKDELITFLVQELGIKEHNTQFGQRISPKYFALPTTNNQPLPSPELTKYLEIELTDSYEEFQYWQIDCYETVVSTKNVTALNIIKLLQDIHFLAIYNAESFQIGSDLLFWYHYTQNFKQVILKDQFIPALKYRQLSSENPKKKGKNKTYLAAFEIYATWEIISEQYEANILKYIDYMPLICVAGKATASYPIEFFEQETLLRHFSEYVLDDLVTHTPSTAAFDKQIADSLIESCFSPRQHNPLTTNTALEEYRQWLVWKTKITRTQADSPFHLCFQLHSPSNEQIDNWQIQFLVASKQDPSLKLALADFLNPGYLGKEAQFRKIFEIPIQKDNDRVKSATLKKLVEPLILRRLKTDQSIINDLPDKVEQKLYTNLTKEQASLYEVVVLDVEKQLQSAEGIQRKGLILSTLMKLKQICNHPAQFLQDGSDFSPLRSHKLSRLAEMVEEAVDEGESLLIFSQFTEVGEKIEKHLKHSLHCNTYYLHGGTSRPRREQMITEFQDPNTEPSVFILSLKAGGVGITLTKANHVFHFDRWWNPAVEDQATDRAFRIGQKKNVFVHKFVAIGTLEERIDQMIEDKKKLSDAVVGSDESWLTELDNEAFKRLISLNKSAILE